MLTVLSISNILVYSLCVQAILSYKQKALHEEIVRYTLEKVLTGHQNEQKVVKRMVFSFPWDGVDTSVELYPSRNLLGERTSSELSSYNPVRKLNEFNYFCEYVGQLKNMPASIASFSVCDNLSGMILEGGATLLFAIFGNHSIENEGLVQLRRLNITGKCNEEKPLKISNHNIWTPSVPENYDNPRYRREINQVPKNFVNGWIRYVETIIVADFSLKELFERDRDAIVSRCISIVNNANVILKPLDIVIVLVDVDFIDSESALSSSNDHVQMLKNYSPWRAKLIERGKKHDYTIFLCGSNFYGDTVGYAFIGTMCTLDQSTAVIQHYPRSASAAEIANVVAHEMGHTLGSRHDSSFCKAVTNSTQDSCVMTGSSIKNSCWTNCTKIYIAHNIDRFSCLLNVPGVIKNFPSCGNGRVDHGEQCDCGAKWENPCCDCITCNLKSHSVCATGPCCNLKTCRPFPGGTQCRKSVNECDLPEYCSGYVEFCPKDVYKHDGFHCDSYKGLCYRGKCGSYGLWCEQFMIPSAKKPQQKFLDKLLSVGLYSSDKICNSLFCQPYLKVDLTSNSNHLFNDRKFISYQMNPLIAYENVETDGLTCDANKTCVDKQCRPVSPPSNVICASGCSGHGICNSEGNCHCEDKFSPPDCVDPGFGGSIDSGYAWNPHDVPDYAKRMLWVLLAVLPPVAILCCLWINIKLLWDNNGKDTCTQNFPNCSKFIEYVCCPCMLFLNRWLCTMGYDALAPKPSYCDDEANTLESRQTICQVDKDVKLPDAEVRMWGVASDALFTDLITITPKNSPRTTRKIRLPPDSPMLRSKSMEHLPGESKAKPKYMKSISKDSGNVSDVDEAHHDHHPLKFKTSMSSLISTFAKYGQHKPGTEDTKDGDHVHSKKSQSSASKTQNLRRMVVDPLFNQKNIGVGGSPTSRPDFRRSLSTDVPRTNHNEVQRSMFPPPSPLGQSSLLNSPKIHSSEQHLHFISAEFEIKQGNVSEKNASLQHQEKRLGSSLKITKALLPPNKKKPIENDLPV